MKIERVSWDAIRFVVGPVTLLSCPCFLRLGSARKVRLHHEYSRRKSLVRSEALDFLDVLPLFSYVHCFSLAFPWLVLDFPSNKIENLDRGQCFVFLTQKLRCTICRPKISPPKVIYKVQSMPYTSLPLGAFWTIFVEIFLQVSCSFCILTSLQIL